jgi:hypothetical protein
MSGNLQRIYYFSGLLFITMNLLWPLFENEDPFESWCIMPYTAYLWNSSQHIYQCLVALFEILIKMLLKMYIGEESCQKDFYACTTLCIYWSSIKESLYKP